MAWRYRRSVRLPFGFRLNASKSGLGFSWGFKGFRVGRDAKGNIVRTVSIPGTGLYNRQVIGPTVRTCTPVPITNPAPLGLYSLFAVFMLVSLLSALAGAFHLAVPCFILAVVSLAAILRRKQMTVLQAISLQQSSRPSPEQLGSIKVPAGAEIAWDPRSQFPQAVPVQQSPPASAAQLDSNKTPANIVPDARLQRATLTCPELDALAAEVKSTLDKLEAPLKEELRQWRVAGSARRFLDAEVCTMIARTGFDGNRYSDWAIDLNLCICRYAHPRQWRLFNHAAMAKLMTDLIQQDREYILPAQMKPNMLQHLQSYDGQHGTQFAFQAAELFLKVAAAAAMVDGAIPEAKKAILQKLAVACSV